MKGKGLFLKMHVVFERNLGKVPGYETEAGLVKREIVKFRRKTRLLRISKDLPF